MTEQAMRVERDDYKVLYEAAKGELERMKERDALLVACLRNEYREMAEQRIRVDNSLLNALYEMRQRAIRATFAELGLEL